MSCPKRSAPGAGGAARWALASTDRRPGHAPKTSLACCCDQRWKETRRFPDRQVSTKATEKAQVEALSFGNSLGCTMTKASFTVVILLALTMPANAQINPRSTANDMLSGCKGFIGDKTPPSLKEALGQGRCAGYVAGARRERGGRARPEPHRTTRYDQGPVAAPSRRFSFCLSSRARVLTGPDTPSAASSLSGTRSFV